MRKVAKDGCRGCDSAGRGGGSGRRCSLGPPTVHSTRSIMGDFNALPVALLLTAQVLLAHTPAAALSAAEFFHICRRSDPHLGECIKKSMTEALPQISKGIPELKIVSHDPLKVAKLAIKQGQGPVSIDSTFTDQIFRGLGKAEFGAVKPELDKNRITFQFSTPYLIIEGNYSMNGRILLVPIKGQGYGRSNYSEVSGTAVLRGHRDTRKGKEYLEVDAIDLDISVKRAKIGLDNLFNGDELLADTVGKVIEENWELLYNELKPVVEESIGLLVRETARRVFQRFPLDELFPQ